MQREPNSHGGRNSNDRKGDAIALARSLSAGSDAIIGVCLRVSVVSASSPTTARTYQPWTGFISRFGKHNFIKRGITLPTEVINSQNTQYVLRQIRQLYLRDSTVTIVLVGKCTWARRFVDWELRASLQRRTGGHPNGLIGILLDNPTRPPRPPRFELNRVSGYAFYHRYPGSVAALEEWIEDAYQARVTRRPKIKNPRERFRYNRSCK